MEIHPRTKHLVFELLRARNVTKAVVDYSGGNDEGDIDIVLHGAPDKAVAQEQDFPGSWEAEGEDKELAKLLESPINDRYGSWGGSFSANGTLIWDVEANDVIWDEDYESYYPED